MVACCLQLWVGSVCMQVMDVHAYGVDLVSITFWGAFTHDTQVPPQASWCEGRGMSYNSQSHLVFLQGKVNSARYIAQIVNSMLLPFLQQEGDVLFSMTTHFHVWLLQCNMLFVVYNSPGQQDPQISHQLNKYGIWWSRNLLFLQSPPQPLLNCDIRCKILGIIYRRMTSAPLWPFACEKTCPHCHQRRVHCIDVTDWASLTVTCVLFGLKLLSLEPGFPCKCMFLYKVVTLLKLCRYSFYDLTTPNIDTFSVHVCIFWTFGE